MSSLRSRVLLAAVTLAVAGAPLSPAAASDFRPAGYADASISTTRVVVPMTFPVIGPVSYSDTFLACRSGCTRKHFGQDLMGPKMNVAVATFNGVVHSVKRETTVGDGNYITLRGDNGWSANYIHMNNDTPGTDDGRGTAKYFTAPGIREGKRVFEGEILGWIGDSGNAEGTAPHLHFELRKGDPWSGTVYNAFASLNAARRLSKPLTSGPHAQGTVVKGCATCGTWQLDRGLRRRLYPEVATQLGVDLRHAVTVTWNELNWYRAGAPVALPDGRAFKGPDGKTWFVHDGRRYAVPAPAALTALGIATARVRATTDTGLRTVPLAATTAPLPTGVLYDGALFRAPTATPTWWYLVDGVRRPVSNAETLKSWGLADADALKLPVATPELPVVLPPLGPPIQLRDGALLKAADGRLYIVSAGQKRPVHSVKAATYYGYAGVLQQPASAAVLWRLPTGPQFP